MFRRILYATDASEHAHKALAYARDLAGRYEAAVVIVNAYSSVDTRGPGLRQADPAQVKALERAALDLRSADIDVVTELVEGSAADVILRVARSHDCDLIILGARGLSPLQGLLLGSVSQQVIQRASCPVLVIR